MQMMHLYWFGYTHGFGVEARGISISPALTLGSSLCLCLDSVLQLCDISECRLMSLSKRTVTEPVMRVHTSDKSHKCNCSCRILGYGRLASALTSTRLRNLLHDAHPVRVSQSPRSLPRFRHEGFASHVSPLTFA